MAKQTINQGTAPTGVGGDTFRSGSAKLQANDNELYDFIGGAANTTTLPAALPITKGGTGATTAAAARTNLGLGTAATRGVGTSAGDVMEVGAFGMGGLAIDNSAVTNLANMPSGFFRLPNDSSLRPPKLGSYDAYGINVKRQAQSYGAALWLPYVTNGKGIAVSAYSNSTVEHYHILTDRNTTTDANGFIKAASPIVQLFADKIELNDEAQQQNIEFEKLGVGNYLIKGSSGFAQEGWYIETPKDANGNLLVAVVYEQLENGDISVKTYDYMLNNKGRIVADTETPLDIPEARWIDLRLQELPQPEIEVTDDPEQ